MQYYVYEHWRPDSNLPFYVGKGKKDRARVLGGRSKPHQEIVSVLAQQQLKVDVRIVVKDLTEKEAFSIEGERVAFWRAKDIQLVNLTNGGDGTWGLKYTEARRQKLSRKLKGKKRTPEQCKTMSEAQKRRPSTSEETRKKLSVAGKNRVLSEAHKQRISVALTDKPKSEKERVRLRGQSTRNIGSKRSSETKVRMSAAQKKRVLPPEVWDRIKAGLSKAHKGRVPSGESRRKMSASQTGRTHSEETKQKMRLKAFEREASKRAIRTQVITTLSSQKEKVMANISA